MLNFICWLVWHALIAAAIIAVLWLIVRAVAPADGADQRLR